MGTAFLGTRVPGTERSLHIASRGCFEMCLSGGKKVARERMEMRA